MLNWVQYPEDDDTTRTKYTYDNMYRMVAASTTTDTGLALSANYCLSSAVLPDGKMYYNIAQRVVQRTGRRI